jgi:hypothetical protein
MPQIGRCGLGELVAKPAIRFDGRFVVPGKEVVLAEI